MKNLRKLYTWSFIFRNLLSIFQYKIFQPGRLTPFTVFHRELNVQISTVVSNVHHCQLSLYQDLITFFFLFPDHKSLKILNVFSSIITEGTICIWVVLKRKSQSSFLMLLLIYLLSYFAESVAEISPLLDSLYIYLYICWT